MTELVLPPLIEHVFKNQDRFDVRFFDSVSSTNDLAKQDALEMENPTVFIANHQLSGRGRFDRRWIDQKNSCLLSTWIWPGLRQPARPQWTLAFGLAVAKSFEACFPELQVSVKPPNDIYVQGKKMGGLLLEAVSSGSEHALILGLGIDVLSAPVDEAISLTQALAKNGQRLDGPALEKLLQNLITGMLKCFAQVSSGTWDPSSLSTELCPFINRFAQTPIIAIRDDGSLETKAGLISWQNL